MIYTHAYIGSYQVWNVFPDKIHVVNCEWDQQSWPEADQIIQICTILDF